MDEIGLEKNQGRRQSGLAVNLVFSNIKSPTKMSEGGQGGYWKAKRVLYHRGRNIFQGGGSQPEYY